MATSRLAGEPLRAEFTAEHIHTYDRISTLWCLLYHTARYSWLVLGNDVCIVITQALYAVVPVITGQAFDLVLDPAANRGSLLNIAGLLLAVMVVRVFFDIAAFFSIETLGQRRSEEHTSELQSRGHLVCR